MIVWPDWRISTDIAHNSAGNLASSRINSRRFQIQHHSLDLLCVKKRYILLIMSRWYWASNDSADNSLTSRSLSTYKTLAFSLQFRVIVVFLYNKILKNPMISAACIKLLSRKEFHAHFLDKNMKVDMFG